jgi:hypothetical protein
MSAAFYQYLQFVWHFSWKGGTNSALPTSESAIRPKRCLLTVGPKRLGTCLTFVVRHHDWVVFTLVWTLHSSFGGVANHEACKCNHSTVRRLRNDGESGAVEICILKTKSCDVKLNENSTAALCVDPSCHLTILPLNDSCITFIDTTAKIPLSIKLF